MSEVYESEAEWLDHVNARIDDLYNLANDIDGNHAAEIRATHYFGKAPAIYAALKRVKDASPDEEIIRYRASWLTLGTLCNGFGSWETRMRTKEEIEAKMLERVVAQAEAMGKSYGSAPQNREARAEDDGWIRALQWVMSEIKTTQEANNESRI